MTTAPDRIAVIAMQLARTDRRALSQAWYDALHHAQPGSKAATPAGHASVAADALRPPARRGETARASAPARARTQRGTHEMSARAMARDPELIAPPLARKITAAVNAPRGFARTVTLGSSRVRLLVRTDAGGTRIVALCASADRERVARALAQVRVALAAAGVTLAA
jgi:hypothetical protein